MHALVHVRAQVLCVWCLGFIFNDMGYFGDYTINFPYVCTPLHLFDRLHVNRQCFFCSFMGVVCES